MDFNKYVNQEIYGAQGGGGGDFLIKVGRDVRRVQNLGWTKFSQKTQCPGKNAQKPNDRAGFHEL